MEKIRGFEVAKGFEDKGINLPIRKTKYSAGYDIEAAEDCIIPKFVPGQKPVLVRSKKAISNFKLREGMPVMLKVTLRGERAYDFLDRFCKLVLPRVRDFSGISKRNFDPKGNLNFGLQNYNIFPELGVDDVTIPMGVQITVVSTGGTEESSQALLEEM